MKSLPPLPDLGINKAAKIEEEKTTSSERAERKLDYLAH